MQEQTFAMSTAIGDNRAGTEVHGGCESICSSNGIVRLNPPWPAGIGLGLYLSSAVDPHTVLNCSPENAISVLVVMITAMPCTFATTAC